MRVHVERDPFAAEQRPSWYPPAVPPHAGFWPARWVSHPDRPAPPLFTAYRRRFTLEKAQRLRVHVSADERYILFLDGERVGRGPERGDAANWFFESYELKVGKGRHVLSALVWSAGWLAPTAQLSVAPGLIVAGHTAEANELLATGVAAWEACLVTGLSVHVNHKAFLAGGTFVVDGREYPWGVERGAGGTWSAVREGAWGRSAGACDRWGGMEGHQLRPATLPPQLERLCRTGRVRHVSQVPSDDTRPIRIAAQTDLRDQHLQWNALITETGSASVPPHTCMRVIYDLGDYYCAYPRLTASRGRGARVRIGWAEASYAGEECGDHTPKDDRDEIDGKHLLAVGDTFVCDGGNRRVFEPPWWRAGRYLEVVVTTDDDPVILNALLLHETRYPLEPQSSFSCDDERMMRIIPIMVRSLEMCSHETFMDCPYYEQLMYVGDTRLEALITLCLSRDERLVRKAIEMFGASRMVSGLTQSRYPGRGTQVIPPFSLWWCCMLHDFALWRGDQRFVRRFMPGARGVLDAFLAAVGDSGLYESLPGWNYMDWTRAPGWDTGVPPEGARGASAMINWQLVYTLVRVSELEAWMGEDELAARWRRAARTLSAALNRRFWDARRGLFADDASRKHWSEHTQCLAVLSGMLDARRTRAIKASLAASHDLVPTTIYFSHYLFEAYRSLGLIDRLFGRLQEWYELADLGMKTTRENPEPTRSDCHAWGAHPLYHYFATVAGIRPGAFGFTTVRIRPAMGRLTSLRASLVHPAGGAVALDLTRDARGKVAGTVDLPAGVRGVLEAGGRPKALHPGRNRFRAMRTTGDPR